MEHNHSQTPLSETVFLVPTASSTPLPAKPVFFLLIFLAIFVFHYLYTTLRFRAVVNRQAFSKLPPVLPHAIPFLGHALSFSGDTPGFTYSIKKQFDGIPVRLHLIVMDIILITKASDIAKLFGQSQFLTNKIYREFVSNTFGVPQTFKEFFAADDTGLGREPHPWSTVKPEHRVDYLMHSFITRFLSGPSLKPLAARFSQNLTDRFDRLDIAPEWSAMPDLYAFLQVHLFHASVEAMFGSFMFTVNPDFCEDFWRFENGVPDLAKGYPRWFNRASYTARDKCLASVHKWQELLKQKRLSQETVGDAAYHPIFGSEIVRKRHDAFSKMEPMSSDAWASEDLALIWGANSNATHAAFWLVYEILGSPGLLARFREEISTAQVSEPNLSGSPSFDLSKLCASPFLQSLYAETLRLRVANIILRTPHLQEMDFGRWRIPRGSIVAAMSYIAHRDEKLYRIGSAKDPHPLDQFWAERFLDYDTLPTKESISKENPDLSRNPRFCMDGLAGAWMPYGGGSNICPGRHFAKQEILLTAALLISTFDIQLEGPGPDVDWRFFGTGTLGVKGKTVGKIRRRKL